MSAPQTSLAWLINEYKKSHNWLQYSPSTRRERENIFKRIITNSDNCNYKAITKQVILASRDQRLNTPAAARAFLKAMNGLFIWAEEREFIAINPCYGVKYPKLTNTDGFVAWNETDIARYHSYYPLGTRARLFLDILLYTGLRRGDVVRIGYKNVFNNVIFLKTEKSKFQIEIALPILPKLKESLEAGPIGYNSFISSVNGAPLTKESFGNIFREMCNKAGIKKSAHGVRKLSATRAANAGATVAELKAIFGWSDDEMASLYTKTADRRRLAANAIEKLNGV